MIIQQNLKRWGSGAYANLLSGLVMGKGANTMPGFVAIPMVFF